ncbi:MAG: hypothetical protein E6J41_20710 [Chloroflexi bacterium]|nr:MAG: hypothetical protein E6J41_20710 [Chloroflexota bacterium]
MLARAAGAADAGGGQERTRSRGRRRLTIGAAGAAVLAVAIAAVAGVRLLQPSPAPAPPLAVTAVAAAADPADGAGHCPAATITLRATVTTNGAPGTLTYEWLRPDGGAASTGRVALRRGDRTATVQLPLAYSGAAAVQGVAALHVLSPAGVYSRPLRVTYACP